MNTGRKRSFSFVPLLFYAPLISRDSSSAQKILRNSSNLCYPVKEALKGLCWRRPFPVSVWAYGNQISGNDRFQLRWWDVPLKEYFAYACRDRKVGFVSVFPLFLLNEHVRGDRFSKVIHDQVCKDFLRMFITFFECNRIRPTVYFKSRKEVSIPHRQEYNSFNRWTGYRPCGRFVRTVS